MGLVGAFALFAPASSHAQTWTVHYLHPTWAEASVIRAVSGTRQAGYAIIDGKYRAGFWAGTAASFVNLHNLLAPNYSESRATSIWSDGSTVFVGGYATHADTGRDEAILWRFTPPPSRPTLSNTGKRKLQVAKARHAVRGKAADADGDLRRVEVKVGKRKFRKAKGTSEWSYAARFSPGRNAVQARAIDARGNRSKVAKIVIVRK